MTEGFAVFGEICAGVIGLLLLIGLVIWLIETGEEVRDYRSAKSAEAERDIALARIAELEAELDSMRKGGAYR